MITVHLRMRWPFSSPSLIDDNNSELRCGCIDKQTAALVGGQLVDGCGSGTDDKGIKVADWVVLSVFGAVQELVS